MYEFVRLLYRCAEIHSTNNEFIANNFFNNYAPVGASYFVSAGTSGFLATLITHPFDVVRTRYVGYITDYGSDPHILYKLIIN